MNQSYVDYAMSVILDRAIPDVRDGLKPVHRRILYAMHEQGMTPAKATRKSAGVVGEVLKLYHPHGDKSVYDAAVRMAQPWSLLHPLITGQGNFGSIDGDGPAAYRYTEMKLAKLAMHFFGGLDQNAVDVRDNFDATTTEPTILPTAFPNILVNGTDGIAVGLATSIPPHNLREVVNAVFAYLDNSDITAHEISKVLTAPDFPTGGIVHDLDGYIQSLETGRGTMKLRGTWHAEEYKNKPLLVIDSIPYQVKKMDIVTKIGDLVQEKIVDDVTDIRDETNRTKGVRIVVEMKRGGSPELLFNQLLAHKTGLETTISYNCMLLIGHEPRQMGILEILKRWVDFRIETIRRITEFKLGQAKDKLHVLEGLIKALGMLDEVIALIRASKSPSIAKEGLISLLRIDEIQASAILEMRLHRLTSLEIEGVTAEHAGVAAKVADLEDILAHRERQEAILREDLKVVGESFGVDRMTSVSASLSRLKRADMIEREEVVVVITTGGYVKRIPVTAMSRQNRGTRGRSLMPTGETDTVEAVHSGSTHDYLLAFTESGQVHARKVYEIEEKPRFIRRVIDDITDDDKIVKLLTVPDFSEDLFLVTVSAQGSIKRTKLSEYVNATRRGGTSALKIEEGDAIAAVDICKQNDHIFLIASNGKAIHFIADDVNMRVMGRTAVGSRGIRIDQEDKVVGMVVVTNSSGPDVAFGTEDYIICIGERGIGKKTPVSEFPEHARGGQGVVCFKITNKTGGLIKALGSHNDSDLIMMSSNGISNRVAVAKVSTNGRAASGSILMNLDDGDRIVAASLVVHENDSVEDESVGE